MKFWKDLKFEPIQFNIIGKRKKICNNIFTFDIETTSIIKIGEKILPATDYQKLDKKSQEQCKFLAFMYIWQFSIDETVYYGRTWQEFKEFIEILENKCNCKKIVFVHNLSFEFQFLYSHFNLIDVLARKSRHVMKASMQDYNIELRCTYMMSNVALKILASTYKLPVQKLSGDLDYSLIRNSLTVLDEKELKYCENDCLVVYYYIKMELETYETVDKIPLTFTGHVRRELRKKTITDWKYRKQVYKSINVDGKIYNRLIEAFQGGYTHANWFYTDKILKNIDSYDFTSSYPFVMVSEKYPMTEFKKCRIKKEKDMMSRFAYILVVKFKNIKSKYYNNFISFSKGRNISHGEYDNGRVVSADELEMTLTDIDFKIILKSYSCEYEILESYFSLYKYLPETFYNFILDKYVEKTKLKNVEGQEVNYALAKNSFNTLYGMSVTNNIKDEVIFENNIWSNRKLENTEILMKLSEEKSKSFLSFSWGVWVTAYARRNLIENIIANDDYVVYCDTDSIKLVQGYDKKVIENYNKMVENKLKKISKTLGIKFSRYAPEDVKGKSHLLGLFEKEETSKINKEFTYQEFITQGTKKYAYRTMKDYEKIYFKIPNKKGKYYFKILTDKIKITVSGVPKQGAIALKNDISNFKDNLIFKSEDTGKKMLMYNDFQEDIFVTDYQGNEDLIHEPSGVAIVPATYELNKSYEYTEFLNDNSEARAIYKE